uniref:phosphoserine transaminase n=1 Tax=Mantoniella antarctica TaxID=81844 RepID=A0A7S0SDZ2_9CHLO
MATCCMTSGVALSARFAGKKVVARRSVPAATVRRGATVTAAAAAPATAARKFNFSAGPAMLPLDVLEECKEDMINYKGTGMSVMEMSHRGKDFMKIASEAEADLRELVGIPDNYKVLFLQGGASSQFAAIPMNLAPKGGVADFITTGAWGVKAIAEAKKYMDVNEAATSKASNFSTIPDASEWKLTPGAKFVHICSNETIGGVEFKDIPDTGDVPLVADMSSNYLSKPIDVKRFGLIYGGVQKNIGPAGMAIIIVREDLIGETNPVCPTMFDYKLMADNESMYNTPPCWTMYTSGLVFKKLLKMGGLEAVEKANQAKAKMLYDTIDGSDGYYVSPVDPKYRSLMNVPFTLGGGADLEKKFLKEADALGLESLKGHRSVGGARASIYNAMPVEGVQALVDFMTEFKASN